MPRTIRRCEVIKKVFLITAVLTLAGCAGDNKILVPELVDRPKLALPSIRPVDQYPVRWVVITRSNANEKLTANPTLIGLSPSDYQNLSLSIAELRRYIKQQNASLKAAKDYYQAGK